MRIMKLTSCIVILLQCVRAFTLLRDNLYPNAKGEGIITNQESYNRSDKLQPEKAEKAAKDRLEQTHVHACIKETCPEFSDDLEVKGVAVKGDNLKIHEDLYVLYYRSVKSESDEWYKARYTSLWNRVMQLVHL